MSLRALAFAVVVAVISATLLVLYLRKLEVETSGGAPVRVLMTNKPIERGVTLTEDMLTVRSVPQAYVESRALRESDRPSVLGIKVETRLEAQQTMMWTDLATTTSDRRSLEDVVQPSMRAVAIRPSADDAHFALIRPGARVDVVANLPHPSNEHQRVAIVIAQNLLVLAVGRDMGGETIGARAPGERQDHVLTLSATMQQVQQLALAAERGKLTVAAKSRSGSADIIESPGEMQLRDIFKDVQPKAALGPVGPAVPRSLSKGAPPP